MNMTEAMRDAIQRDGRSLRVIESETGVTRGLISRFLRGERTMTAGVADKIIDGLGLTVKIGKGKTGGTASKARKGQRP